MTGAAGLAFGPGLRAGIKANLDAFERRAQPESGLRRAAVTMTVVDDGDGRAAFVLTRRAETLRRAPGQWALPGGRLDAGESPPQAALRELREEVGLAAAPSAVLGLLDDYTTRSGHLITPVVIWGGAGAAFTANPDEVDSVYLIALAELFAPGSPEFVTIPESDRPVIRMRIRGSRIHAPTAAVMYQFREVALCGRDTRVAHLEQPLWAWP